MSEALSVYNAHADIRSEAFTDNYSREAVNCKHGSVIIANSLFTGNRGKGIDFNFCHGFVQRSGFAGNCNDGGAMTGSQILLVNNLFRDNGDKGISVGEKSRPVIFNNVIRDNSIGISVKDYSIASILSNSIIGNRFRGIELYNKKNIYGGGQARIMNNSIHNNKTAIFTDSKSKYDAQNNFIAAGPGLHLHDVNGIPFITLDSERQYLQSAVFSHPVYQAYARFKDQSTVGILPWLFWNEYTAKK